jgi:DeoR/GlpR family transcriptional regulator of sugar metabolism
MYKSERKQDIIALLQERGFTSTLSLAQQLSVSQATIYRYLKELESDGLIRKEYGGVQLEQPAPDSTDFDFRWRQMEHQLEKQAIAGRAAGLIEPGDTVFLDSSTTNIAFAQRLARTNLQDVTIVTNSARIVLVMQSKPEVRLICTGGAYLARHDTLVGSPAEEFIATLNANKCFFSAYGVTLQGCSDADPADVRVKTLMLSRSAVKILLADGSKFGRSTTFTFIQPGDINVMVTDAATDPEVLAPYRGMGIEVLVAEPASDS